MASTAFHELYYHIVWSTKNRQAVITDAMRKAIISEIEVASRRHSGQPLECNVMPDHAHLVLNLPPTIALSEFIGKVKGASSHAINRSFDFDMGFGWQDGYGVISFRKAD